MSVEIYRPNGPNTEPSYKIGTVGWEYRKKSIYDLIGSAFREIPTMMYPMKIPINFFLGVFNGDGAACPTYGLWAGSGWAGGQRLPDSENSKIDWTVAPCMNDSVKTSATPDNCYSLVDAMTKTHDWRYYLAEEQYALDHNEANKRAAYAAADIQTLVDIANVITTGQYESPTGTFNKNDRTWAPVTYTGTFDSTEKGFLSGLVPAFLVKILYLEPALILKSQAISAFNTIMSSIPIDGVVITDPMNPTNKTKYYTKDGIMIAVDESSKSSNASIMSLDANSGKKPAIVSIDYGAGSTKAENTFVIKDGGTICINGGTGNDEIRIARNNNDTGTPYTFEITGGAGNDTYYLDANFNYKLIDSGENIIFIEGNDGWINISSLFKNPGETFWQFDGIKYENGKITLQNGNTIELGDNFQSGDLGINLITIPDNPIIRNTITGDLTPIDFDPATEGIQMRHDDQGNLIVDSSKPWPGYDDCLFGTTGSDFLYGKAGGDVVSVGQGNNWLSGGDGSDGVFVVWSTDYQGNNVLEGNAGSDVVKGGSGNDKVFGENYGDMEQLINDGEAAVSIHAKGDLVSGGRGNDYVYGANRNDALFGGYGKDLLVGSGGDDLLIGDDDDFYLYTINHEWSYEITETPIGNTIIYTVTKSESFSFYTDPNGILGDDDILYGGTGNDYIPAGGGDDDIYGGSGNDSLFGEAGNDFISGGDGDDAIKGDAYNVPLDYHGNDYIDGGAGNDLIWGNAGNDDLYGGAGNDKLCGDEGDDYLSGEAGFDSLYGGAGDDVMFGGDDNDYMEGDYSDIAGNDYLDGEDGNDTLIGAGGADTIYGGDGNDILHGDASNLAATDYGNDYIDGEAGDDTLLGYAGNDTLYGGDGDDSILGDTGDDYIDGEEGNNSLYGGEGDNEIYAGTGNDYIVGGSGIDCIDAGDGNNTVFGGANDDEIYAGASADWIQGDAGDDYLDGGAGNNTILGGEGNDELFGGADIDSLQGDAGDDYLQGFEGNDVITGGYDSDTLFGDAGDDYLVGDSGNDYLDGGTGNDTMIGYYGDDTYIFDSGYGQDRIEDFEVYDSKHDKILFGEGIATTDIILQRSQYGGDLIISISGTTDSLTIQNWFYKQYRVERFEFFDGTVWDDLYIRSMVPIAGTAGADSLSGFGSDDYIDGKADADTMNGGSGNDIYIVDDSADAIVENYNSGDDLVMSSVNYSMPSNVENLTLTGNSIVTGTGNILNNVLTGNNAASNLIGGQGDDIYIICNSTTVIVENAGEGTNDNIQSSVAYTMGNNTEQMILTGTGAIDGTGNGNDNEIRGNLASNVLSGGGGNDIVAGGSGDDQLYGGTGNDYLYGGTGNDALDGGDGNDQLFGGSGTNTLAGGAGNDILQGGIGGYWVVWDGEPVMNTETGINIMVGNTGDDTYNVYTANDAVIENTGEGNDTVNAYIESYTLTDNIEVLRLNGESIINGSGNSLNNQIYGNSINNILYGGAGNDELNGLNGDDTLNGGAGNDVLYGGGAGRWYLGDWILYDTFNGNDSYQFGIGSGQDIIKDRDASDGNIDTILLDDGIQASDVYIRRVLDEYMSDTGDYLVLSIKNTEDSLTILNWFDESNDWKVEQIKFSSGLVWDVETINQLVLQPTGNDDYLVGYGGNDTLSGQGGNDYIYGGTGDDLIDGGTGNDELVESPGNDTYLFGRGYGQDIIDKIIESTEIANGVDTVQMAADITTKDISLTRIYITDAWSTPIDNLQISINGTTDSLTIVNWFNQADDRYVDRIVFTDNTVWDVEAMLSILSLQGTDSNDTLTGFASSDNLKGFAGNDYMSGMDGDDTLDGGTGSDSMYGGTGNDIYIVDNIADILTENANEGTADTVKASITYTLGANVENLILTGSSAISGTGNTLDNYLTGNSAINTLTGGAGNDTLDGGASGDSLVGGAGDDVYIVDNTGDKVTESASSGTDTVRSSVGCTLAANVENLILTGTGAINGTGNTLANTITGNSGANTLSGGTGADAMIGGAGNDIYVVDNTGDGVTEYAGEGTDMVQSSIAYTLGNNVENLTLTGTAAINGTGNELDNYLIGNSGVNTLTGGAGNDTIDGGSGADAMYGGTGNDTYIRDNTGDTITENAGEGTDTVQTSLAYTLGNNLENLVLTGTSAINGTGNTLDNYLTGNSVINTLTGNDGNDTLDGGAGADALAGGSGNDFYILDNSGDTVTEAANAGTDTVQSSVAYTLGSNVENLILTGTSAINGTGNTLANDITGNSIANIITGGVGNDTLAGGAGNDTYVFNIGDGVDTITDTYRTGEGNIISFGAGITSYNLTLNLVDSILTIHVGNNGDAINLVNFDRNNAAGSQVIGTLQFSDGTQINLMDVLNDPPVVSNSIADQTATEDALFSFSIPADTFTDPEGDAMTYSATLSDGSALPSWLTFDPTTGTFSGTPINENVGTISVKVTATDTAGGKASDQFAISVLNTNDTPVVENSILNQKAEENSSFTFTVPGNTFKDVDADDTLTYSTTLNDGSSLPAWLSFDATTRTFTGTPANSDIGTLALKLKSTDTSGASAETEFSVLVRHMNHAPVVANPISDQSATEDAVFSFTVPSGTFTDVDAGDSLTYSATLSDGSALPSWLSFNSTTRTFSGTPTNDNVGTLALKVTATDIAGASVATTFNVNVANVNDAPMVSNAIPDQSTLEGSAFSYTVPSNTFTDADAGDVLTYSATLSDGSALPSWLSFNTATRTLTGTPGAEGAITVKVTASDLAGATASATFDLTIKNNAITGTEGDDNLVGTSDGNIINGLGGNDTLDGGSGVDTLVGGTGNDIYVVDNAGDVVTENAGEGTDTVQTSLASILGSNIENLTLTGTSAISGAGNTLDNYLTGNSAANTMTGNAGNDTLDGGSGADSLVGGAGNDVYFVDNTGDVVTESASSGIDTVYSSITYTLGANVENLVLTGTGAINGTGNTLANTLTGNSAANTLSGGTGADTLIGGAGNDTYIVDNASDKITENAGEGIDLVQTSVTYTLAANVENLNLTGTSAISGTGNTLDNYLTGNSGANTLTGNTGNDTLNGGTGKDTMIGGTGDDTYFVDNTGDVVTESASSGVDTVYSAIAYTLGSNVENVVLTGTGTLNGTGNTLANLLTGNSAANTLTGNAGNDTLDGGMGSDSLVGGTGNDTYLFRRTDGIDSITDYSTTATDSDTLKLTDGITSTEPVIVKQNGDLYIFVDTGNYMKIASQFTATTYGIERLEVSDGHYITRSDIETIVNTMSTINNNTGMDVMQKYNAMMSDSTYITTLANTWRTM